MRYADGNSYDGEYKAGEQTHGARRVYRYVTWYADGSVDSRFSEFTDLTPSPIYRVKWMADGQRAARLRDGEEEEEISLEEARQTVERLGLPLPSPLPGAA